MEQQDDRSGTRDEIQQANDDTIEQYYHCPCNSTNTQTVQGGILYI